MGDVSPSDTSVASQQFHLPESEVPTSLIFSKFLSLIMYMYTLHVHVLYLPPCAIVTINKYKYYLKSFVFELLFQQFLYL